MWLKGLTLDLNETTGKEAGKHQLKYDASVSPRLFQTGDSARWAFYLFYADIIRPCCVRSLWGFQLQLHSRGYLRYVSCKRHLATSAFSTAALDSADLSAPLLTWQLLSTLGHCKLTDNAWALSLLAAWHLQPIWRRTTFRRRGLKVWCWKGTANRVHLPEASFSIKAFPQNDKFNSSGRLGGGGEIITFLFKYGDYVPCLPFAWLYHTLKLRLGLVKENWSWKWGCDQPHLLPTKKEVLPSLLEPYATYSFCGFGLAGLVCLGFSPLG